MAEFVNEYGCYCQFDLFGTENSYYQRKLALDYPNDAMRIAMIQNLINEQFENKILVAHDIHTKHRLVNNINRGCSDSSHALCINFLR